MVTILQAVLPEDRAAIEDIFRDYLEWACIEIKREYSIPLEPEAFLTHDMETLQIFLPPQGHLLLAKVDGEVAGMVCMRMTGAHALYHSVGFYETGPYPQSEIPPEFREHWVFMELPLSNSPALPKD